MQKRWSWNFIMGTAIISLAGSLFLALLPFFRIISPALLIYWAVVIYKLTRPQVKSSSEKEYKPKRLPRVSPKAIVASRTLQTQTSLQLERASRLGRTTFHFCRPIPGRFYSIEGKALKEDYSCSGHRRAYNLFLAVSELERS